MGRQFACKTCLTSAMLDSFYENGYGFGFWFGFQWVRTQDDERTLPPTNVVRTIAYFRKIVAPDGILGLSCQPRYCYDASPSSPHLFVRVVFHNL